MADTHLNRDWRTEPRKRDNELYRCVTYLRTTSEQKEALRLMASQRGESEAQFLRSMIDREAKVVFEGQSGEKLPLSRIEADTAGAIMKLIIRSAKSGMRRRRGQQ